MSKPGSTKPEPLKIVIADDHVITRMGIKNSLEEIFPASHVTECESSAEVLKLCSAESVNLALVDLFMPGDDGFGFLKKLCRKHPELPVVVFSATENTSHIQKVIDIGVRGFIHKSSGFDVLSQALNTILSGGNSFPEVSINDSASQEAELDLEIPSNRDAILNNLTRRQLDTLSCLAKGMSNKEIAKTLFISENTVKTHLKAILTELNCHNRTEAVLLSQRLGLIHS
ncbi:MAG: response regulator transcription factor [Candidatus Pelagadaptatus aseana]|uniref:response regulator transcription factor n=1 Tax=Candidatus Pelagadaptatus aseana TaxID=3120508 RepID=UPI0039B13D93